MLSGEVNRCSVGSKMPDQKSPRTRGAVGPMAPDATIQRSSMGKLRWHKTERPILATIQ